MALKKHVKHFFKVIYLHRVHPLSAGGGGGGGGGGGVESPTKFSKKVA